MPQEWYSPLPIHAQVNPPLTPTGASLKAVVPSPISPPVVTPHAVSRPALMRLQVRPPLTVTGAPVAGSVPLPSWPAESLPQHMATPSEVMPQLRSSPALTERQLDMPPCSEGTSVPD